MPALRGIVAFMRTAAWLTVFGLLSLWPARAQNIVPAATLVIPVAGSTPGAEGTFFRTDLTVTNHREVAETVAIAFFGAGAFYYGDPTFETTLELPPGSTTTYEDVVATLLRSGGSMGTIIINPLYPPPLRKDARLSATYRIWTTQPGGTGTLSQSSNALDMAALASAGNSRVVTGVRQDAGFRCNVGIFSNSYYDRTFRVTAKSPSGSVKTTVKAGGFSLTQVPLPSANLGYMTVTIELLDGRSDDVWTAYATSVDNRSGDSWLQNAYSR